MAPSAERYVSAQNGVVRLAVRDLRVLWSRLSRLDPLSKRQALEQFWPVLIGRYGEITASLAADRFEELTGLSPVMVRPVDDERANARMRWAMGAAFEGAPEKSLALLEGLADELVKQPGRSTLIASAAGHGLRFARVPVGVTCPWCRLLGSRGFVYESRASAGERRAFHGDCDCRIAIEGEPTPGYDPDALYAEYQATRT